MTLHLPHGQYDSQPSSWSVRLSAFLMVSMTLSLPHGQYDSQPSSWSVRLSLPHGHYDPPYPSFSFFLHSLSVYPVLSQSPLSLFLWGCPYICLLPHPFPPYISLPASSLTLSLLTSPSLPPRLTTNSNLLTEYVHCGRVKVLS